MSRSQHRRGLYCKNDLCALLDIYFELDLQGRTRWVVVVTRPSSMVTFICDDGHFNDKYVIHSTFKKGGAKHRKKGGALTSHY